MLILAAGLASAGPNVLRSCITRLVAAVARDFWAGLAITGVSLGGCFLPNIPGVAAGFVINVRATTLVLELDFGAATWAAGRCRSLDWDWAVWAVAFSFDLVSVILLVASQKRVNLMIQCAGWVPRAFVIFLYGPQRTEKQRKCQKK
jgi:hypothetical protein